MTNEVRPFRALHYDPDKIENIGLCLAQPYDVISGEQQDGYYEQHPHNVIRLILNKEQPGDILLGLRTGLRHSGDRIQEGEGVHRSGETSGLRGAKDLASRKDHDQTP
jgi:hypothetical protein